MITLHKKFLLCALGMSGIAHGMERLFEAPQDMVVDIGRVPMLAQCALPKFFEWCNKNNVDVIKQTRFPKDKLVELIRHSIWAAQVCAPITITHKDAVTSAQFSSDAKKVITASMDGTAKIVDAQTGAGLFEAKGVDQMNCAVISPDLTRIATGCRYVRIIDAKSGSALTAYRDERKITMGMFSPDSTVCAFIGLCTLFLIHAQSGALIAKIYLGPLETMHFSSDSSKIITTSTHCPSKVIDAKTGALLFEKEMTRQVESAQFSSDSAKIIMASNGSVHIKDARTGQFSAPYIESKGLAKDAIFSPNRKKILMIVDDKKLRIIGAQSGALLVMKTYDDHIDIGPKMSSNSSMIALCFNKGNVHILEADTGKLLLNIPGCRPVRVFEFSPNAKKCAIGWIDGTMQIIDLENGKYITSAKHKQAIRSIGFSSDSLKIVTASDDGTAKIVSAATDDELIGLVQEYSRGQLQKQ